MRTLIGMADPHPILRASLAGRYDIERELGEGGMATVYVAHDVRHGRRVAIKIMRPEVAASLGSERFLSEIKLTAKLQHPHIVVLLDSGAFSDDSGMHPFYVMPFIAGETLRARLAREARVPIPDVLPILIEIADALAYAHDCGIIHRDIKPESILLSQGHALVADFGVAKALHRSLDGASITQTGVSVGTPAYMAPEQVVADPGIDSRADLYALGVIAYEMIAGRTPFVAATMAATVKASLTEDAPLLRAGSELPGAFVVTRRIAAGKRPVQTTANRARGSRETMAVAGVVTGLLGAVALTRVMATLLFGVSTTDLLTFSLVPVVLIGTAVLATYIPALRATRVDPTVALREE